MDADRPTDADIEFALTNAPAQIIETVSDDNSDSDEGLDEAQEALFDLMDALEERERTLSLSKEIGVALSSMIDVLTTARENKEVLLDPRFLREALLLVANDPLLDPR